MKRDFWGRFKATSAHNQASIVFSSLIMLATICYSIIAGIQLHVMRQEAVDNATQTNKLIDAAKRNAAAAESFSASADKIRRGIDDAVGKLQSQVQETQRVSGAAEKQARAAQTSAQTAKDALNMEERAWIASEVKVTGPLHFKEDGVFLPIDFAMTNIGHSPAQDVTTWAQLIPGFAAPTRDEVESYCRVLKQTPGHPPNGIVLFPTGFHSDKQPVGLNRKSIDEALKNSAIPGKIGFHLITCVDYTMGFDPKTHHQTRESYAISWENQGGYLFGAFDPSEEYKTVSLIRQAGGSVY